jgi:hypothetical protein
VVNKTAWRVEATVSPYMLTNTTAVYYEAIYQTVVTSANLYYSIVNGQKIITN